MIRPTGINHIATVTPDLDRFRTFYEEAIGLETLLVMGGCEKIGRHAIVLAGNVVLHVFEVEGYDPLARGMGMEMFERGRIDHLGFTFPDEDALHEVRDRLVAAGAARGEVEHHGPTLSVRFADPDGLELEVNCFNPYFDPTQVRPGDEVVDPGWHEKARALLQGAPAATPV